MRCAASHTSRLFMLVPKLQLGNPDDEAPASRDGKLELPTRNSQAGAWELALTLICCPMWRATAIISFPSAALRVTTSVLRIRDAARGNEGKAPTGNWRTGLALYCFCNAP